MDAFARWFAILRELGEVVDFKLLHFDSLSGRPLQQWNLPHEEYDGARMMERALGDLGKTLPALPRVREAAPPPFFQRVRAVWREATEGGHAPVPWRRFDHAAHGAADAPFAYTLFEREEVRAIAKRAEAHGARAN